VSILMTNFSPKIPENLNLNSSLCSTMTEIRNSTSLKFYPVKIVAEPWRGEHNVYAVFALPLQYQEIFYRSFLVVKGTDTHWYAIVTDGKKYGVAVPKDSFLMVGFFRTRLAIWYWLTGKFSDLQQPCNWTLHLFP
ncbi:MAG: hypothetical protein ACK451_19910, partial [Pseudanabaena sp.]